MKCANLREMQAHTSVRTAERSLTHTQRFPTLHTQSTNNGAAATKISLARLHAKLQSRHSKTVRSSRAQTNSARLTVSESAPPQRVRGASEPCDREQKFPDRFQAVRCTRIA